MERKEVFWINLYLLKFIPYLQHNSLKCKTQLLLLKSKIFRKSQKYIDNTIVSNSQYGKYALIYNCIFDSNMTFAPLLAWFLCNEMQSFRTGHMFPILPYLLNSWLSGCNFASRVCFALRNSATRFLQGWGWLQFSSLRVHWPRRLNASLGESSCLLRGDMLHPHTRSTFALVGWHHCCKSESQAALRWPIEVCFWESLSKGMIHWITWELN